jgi:hypothetical protein
VSERGSERQTGEEGKEVEDLLNYGSRLIEAVSTTRIGRYVSTKGSSEQVKEWRTSKYAAMSMGCSGGFLKGAQAHNRDIKTLCDYEHMSMAVEKRTLTGMWLVRSSVLTAVVRCELPVVWCELR